MALRQVINLADVPIIRDILSRLANLRDRFARVESSQAAGLVIAREALRRANEALAAAGLPVPPDPDPDPEPQPLTITGTPPTTGTVGQPYSFTPVTAGGSGSRVYSLVSGTLLAGLSLNTSTGAITGTPTAAGAMTGLSVRVTDDTGNAATTPTTVTIAAASGGGTWGGGGGTWGGGGGTWGGGTGGGGTTITLSVGSVTSAAEGTPSAGITLSVGSITTQPEGNPSSGITLSVGSITSQPEGN